MLLVLMLASPCEMVVSYYKYPNHIVSVRILEDGIANVNQILANGALVNQSDVSIKFTKNIIVDQAINATEITGSLYNLSNVCDSFQCRRISSDKK